MLGRTNYAVCYGDSPNWVERFDASPALAGKQLFLRGAKSLYCIETE
jgi:hypothetical protein